MPRVLVVLASVALLSTAPAYAGSYGYLADNYWGGSYSVPGNSTSQDVIGASSVFDISGAYVWRTNNGNTLNVAIQTNYAGAPGTSAALGTIYGSLFFTSASNYDPKGSASTHYSTDVYEKNDWTYAYVTPSTGVTGGLFEIGTTTSAETATNYKNTGVAQSYKTLDGRIIMANMNGNPVSAPNSGNSGYYFRQGQAVQFVPDAGQVRLDGGLINGQSSSFTVSSSFLTYVINDYHTLGDTFAMSWAMTCANDVIQGIVSVPGPIVGGGLPGLAMLLAGLYGWRMRRRAAATLAAA